MKIVGEGLDNVVYETGDGLIVRCAKAPDPEALVREASILAAIAEVSPLAVPRPVRISPERGCLAYEKLPGVPLIAARPSRLDGIVAQLRSFLEVLHRTRVDAAEPDEVPLDAWLDEAAQSYPALAPHIPAVHHPAIAEFLESAPPPGTHEPVFCHNDLGIEHVLVSGGTETGGTQTGITPAGITVTSGTETSVVVTGIIDWSDAALTDPARDYGKLYRDLGPVVSPPAALRDRAVFYARCGVLEDLAFGLSTGNRIYTGKCLNSLRWLFPARGGTPPSATALP